MLNTGNRTLGGVITGTSSKMDINKAKFYTVTFTRVDNRDMTVVVDKELQDKCIHGSRAIFDIDIVMEKRGNMSIMTKNYQSRKCCFGRCLQSSRGYVSL